MDNHTLFDNFLNLVIAPVYHVTVLIHQLYFTFLIDKMDLSKGKTSHHIGEFKYLFLTTWSLALQILFTFVCLYCDILKILDRNKFINLNRFLLNKLALHKNILFWGLIFPLNILVCLCFWIIYYVNREMVMPLDWDMAVPPEVNRYVHLQVNFIIILEGIFLTNEVTQRHKIKLTSLSAVYFIYIVSIIVAYFYTGKWVYPLLESMNWPIRIISFTVVHIVLLCIYNIGIHVNEFGWKIMSPLVA